MDQHRRWSVLLEVEVEFGEKKEKQKKSKMEYATGYIRGHR